MFPHKALSVLEKKNLLGSLVFLYIFWMSGIDSFVWCYFSLDTCVANSRGRKLELPFGAESGFIFWLDYGVLFEDKD